MLSKVVGGGARRLGDGWSLVLVEVVRRLRLGGDMFVVEELYWLRCRVCWPP